MDSDRILVRFSEFLNAGCPFTSQFVFCIKVMSDGQVKEYASPYRLLQSPDSMLYKMVEKTGSEASKKLHQMAVDAR